MSTVIDELVITLGLDPKQFTEGQKQALESFKKMQEGAVQVGKEVEAQGTKVDAFFSNLKRNAVGLLAGFAAGYGVKEFTSYISNLDAATGRVAKTMNMSVRDLSAWQGAIEQNGGSAESATSALQGLSGEMNKFMLTGQTSMLPILNSLGISLFDANKNLKTSGQLLLDISDAIKGMDSARRSATLSLIPGMNQDMVNLLIQGRDAVIGYRNASKEAGGTTDESAAQARAYQRDLANLDRTATNLGRTIVSVTGIFSGLSNVMNGLSTGLRDLRFLPEILTDIAYNIVNMLPDWAIKLLFGSHSLADVRSHKFGSATEDAMRGVGVEMLKEKFGEGTQKSSVSRVPGSTASKAERLAYIRAGAVARRLNPDVIEQMVRKEGLNNYFGDADATGKPTSFGDFQLHYPGIGRNTADGLGSDFTRQTGKDARDQTTWKEQADFALDYIQKNGLSAWHGWKGDPNAAFMPYIGAAGAAATRAPGPQSDAGSSSHSTSIDIGHVHVNAPNAKNADDIAQEIPDALRRQNWAASANYGQQG